jgi:hypothetical protein
MALIMQYFNFRPVLSLGDQSAGGLCILWQSAGGGLLGYIPYLQMIEY